MRKPPNTPRLIRQCAELPRAPEASIVGIQLNEQLGTPTHIVHAMAFSDLMLLYLCHKCPVFRQSYACLKAVLQVLVLSARHLPFFTGRDLFFDSDAPFSIAAAFLVLLSSPGSMKFSRTNRYPTAISLWMFACRI